MQFQLVFVMAGGQMPPALQRGQLLASLLFWQTELSVSRLLAEPIVSLINKKILEIYTLALELIGGIRA